MKNMPTVFAAILFLGLFGCGGDTATDIGEVADTGGQAGQDTGNEVKDAGAEDAGAADSGVPDAGEPDAGHDSGVVDAGHDAGHDGGADAGSGDGGCCVSLTLGDGGTQQFCQGPAELGTTTAANTPTIGHIQVSGGRPYIAIAAGLSKNAPNANAFDIQAFGATGAGTFSTPQIDYWDGTGIWYENNASNGQLVIDAWPAVGSQVTGTFEGQVAQMSGGSAFPAISGTFCAVRQADE